MNSIEVVDVIKSKSKVRRVKKSPSSGETFVGKDILELISLSMYVEPLTMYREYIQNATDSIDQAVACNLLENISEGKIKVAISQSARTIKITDNGTGISKRKFSKLMLSFGASEKRGTEARGFRGVGRFSGLGYCQKITFRTKVASEKTVSEVEWDGRVLKRLLADNSEKLSIYELVNRVAVFSQYEIDQEDTHFFEVELSSVVRMGNDNLLNEEAVKRYISQVCPVPYAHEFHFKEQLEELLEKYNISAGYNIAVEDDYSDGALIHRPYRNSFSLSETESDDISSVDVFKIEGVHGGVSAVGWTFQHDYKGLIPSGSNIRGIRVRVGNTQIGEESLLTDTFPEPRFNSWSMGEIHVLERKITPNGRRDNFDNSIHWLELQNQFSQQTKKIAKICRRNSAERNVIKQFNAEIQRAEEYQAALKSGVLSKAKSKELRESIAATILKAESLVGAKQLGNKARGKLAKVVKKQRLKASPDKLAESSINDIFDVIPKGKTPAVREVFDFIFECSPNKIVAQGLIDKIVDRYRIKYGKS